MSDEKPNLQVDPKYWSQRVNLFGHTGWSNASVYAIDERGWCDIADSVGLKAESRTYYPCWGVGLIEVTLPFLRGVFSRCRDLSSVTSNSDQISSSRNMQFSRPSLILVRILLAITWMIDYVLKFPMPPCCRR